MQINGALTVCRLIELLSTVPQDRKIYVNDDSQDRAANVFNPEYRSWETDGPVVLITWDVD